MNTVVIHRFVNSSFPDLEFELVVDKDIVEHAQNDFEPGGHVTMPLQVRATKTAPNPLYHNRPA